MKLRKTEEDLLAPIQAKYVLTSPIPLCIKSVHMVTAVLNLTIESKNFTTLKNIRLNSAKPIQTRLKAVIMEICVLLLILKMKLPLIY